MLRLELPRRPKTPLRILCLGAHSDDIEIGCGGTLLQLLERPGPVEIDWVVFSGSPVRVREARRSARSLAHGARALRFQSRAFRDGFFPSQSVRIKEEFERLKRRPSPDLVFCPWKGDAHQDHRTLAELAWNTFRDHLILEYEIPKYDGDLRSPNLYVPLSEAICRTKIEHILKAFPSQAGNQWFSTPTHSGRRFACAESNPTPPPDFAEGFYCRKTVLAS